jgi:hypothetical protein
MYRVLGSRSIRAAIVATPRSTPGTRADVALISSAGISVMAIPVCNRQVRIEPLARIPPFGAHVLEAAAQRVVCRDLTILLWATATRLPLRRLLAAAAVLLVTRLGRLARAFDAAAHAFRGSGDGAPPPKV